MSGEPTLYDVLAPLNGVEARLSTKTDALQGRIAALQTEMEANTASILSDVAKQTARVLGEIQQPKDDAMVTWNASTRVEDKVNNLRDEVRLGDQTVRDIMRLFRTLAERVSKLEGERP